MRWLMLVSACLVLAGCERPVLSHHALFRPADARSAPSFREGIWLNGPSDGCEIDLSRPAGQWPDCADWTLIAQGRIVRTKLSGRHAPRRASQPFILAAGDPRILQEAAVDNPGFYRFTVVRPLQSDADGEITAAETWSVVCPPRPDKAERAVAIAGLEAARAACRLRDVGTLNRVIGQAADWAPHQTMHWVRDGDR